MPYVIYIRIKETPIALQFQVCAINSGFEEYQSNSSLIITDMSYTDI